jgi:hypothetical protein
VAELIVVALVVACVLLYVVSGVILYRSLKKAGIESVGSVGVKSFAGTFTDNVFQVVLRYGPQRFSEYVEDPSSKRMHKWAYYSSRCLLVGILVLIVIRFLN